MKNIRFGYLSILLFAFCLLASFTRPLQRKEGKNNDNETVEIQDLEKKYIPNIEISKLQQLPASKVNYEQSLLIGSTATSSVNNTVLEAETSTDEIDNTRLGGGINPIMPLPVKPLPISRAKRLLDIKPVIYSLNENAIEKEYYQYDSVAHTFKKIENIDKGFGLDPVRFRLSASRDSIIVGEEVEIKIVAEYLDIHPSLLFQFEGSNEFTLKMLMPEGFIQTGGSYYDYLQGKVTRNQPRQEFTIKGYFEDIVDKKEFKLLRGSANTDLNSRYYLAGKLLVSQKKTLANNKEPGLQVDNLTLEKIVKGLVPTSSYLSCTTVDISFDKDPICNGVSFTASVSGCYSSVVWVKDYNWVNPLPYSSSSITISAVGTYQAQCQNSCGNTQTATRTTNGQYANQITIEEKTIGCNQSTATLEAVGCNGIVTWDTFDTGTTITKGAGFYIATCNQSCSSTTASASIYSPPPFPNTPTLSTDKIFLCYNESAKLTIDVGCNSGSSIEWVNQPSDINAVGEGIYKIRCGNNCYKSDYSEVSILRNYTTPAAPVIAGATSVCPGSMVSMSFTTPCAPGTSFAWKDGDEFVSHWDAIVSGGSYTINASCTHACSNRTIYSNNITVSAMYNGTTPTIKEASNITSLCGNEQANLTSQNCDGTVVWYMKVNGIDTNIGTGSSKSVGQGTYYARCQNDCGEGNQSNEVTINWNGNYASNISITPGYTDVCDYVSNVTLTVNNCNGYITWSDGQYSGLNTRENQGVGTYKAFCNPGCSTTEATATINHKGYTASTPTLSVVSNKTYLCAGEQTTINAANCNGTVFWNDNESWTGTSITVGVGSYYAKCKTDCNISPASESKDIYNASQISVTSSNTTYQNNTACGATYADISVFSSGDAAGTGYTYNWSHSLGNGRSKRVYGSGTYTVTISGNNLCTLTYSITVNFISKPSAPTLTANSTACIGSSVNISSSCSGTTNFSSAVPFIMGNTPITVYATCTVGGCTSDNSLPITINPITAPATKPVITASSGTIICAADGNIPLTVNCGAGLTPLWSNGATTSQISISSVGDYTVVCKNSCNQSSPVSDVKKITKDLVTVPLITAFQDKTSICGSEIAILNASNCSGTVTWSNGATGSSINVGVSGVGTYSARCTTTCGTSIYSSSIPITTPAVPSIPSVTIPSPSSNICTINGTATFTASCSSGQPAWVEDNNTITATKVVSNAGTYTVRCVNACGIYSSPVTSTITKDPTATPTIGTNTNKICGTETATLTASGCPGSVIWSNGTTANSITVSNAGHYTAICRTSCGDSSPSNQITINKNIPPNPPVLSEPTSRTVCLGGQSEIILASNGCAAHEVVWFGSSSDGLESITRMQTDGTLTVTNSSFNGASMTFRAICQTKCGDSNYSNEITVTKNNFTATAESSSPNGEADEYVNNLTLNVNTTRANISSYAWTGPNNFTSNQKDPVITAANLSYAYSGTYTVTVTDAGGCYATATTAVIIDPVALDCENYYVKSYYSTPTEEETTRLRRIGTTNTFNPISLALEILDGAPSLGINYQWTAPAGATLSPNATAQIVTTSKIGNYNLRISRGSSFCDLPISISGTACTDKGDTFACSSTEQNPTTTPNHLSNLVAGDEIYAADYKLLITEVTGSQSAGWTGKALATFSLLNNFSIEAFPLEFKKISINECYEYIGATGSANSTDPDDFVGIRTEYDSNWANVYSISFVFKGIDEIKQDLIDLFENFVNTPEYKLKIDKKLKELQALVDQASPRQLDPEVKAELQAAIDAIKNPCLPCIEENVTVVNNPNARALVGISGVCDIGSILSGLKGLTPQQLILKCLGGAGTDILFSYVGKWFELITDNNNGNDKNITNFAGITGLMNWPATISSAGISCLQSMNPFTSSKSKLLIAAGIAGEAGGAFFTNIMEQYGSYTDANGANAPILGFYESIVWGPPVIAAVTQALAGLAIEALKAPALKRVAENLKNKIKTTEGYLALQTKVGSLGCSPGVWQEICKSLGVPTLCFPTGTLITTTQGLKPIEQIAINDQVISFKEEKKLFEPKKVKQLFRSTATKLAMVYTLSGNLIASATPEHPFFVKDSYKEAKQLVHGDTLLSYTKEITVVDKVEIVDTNQEVYNFEVEDNHNYLVGESGILVHNNCQFFDVISAAIANNGVAKKLYTFANGSSATLKWLKTGNILEFKDRAQIAAIMKTPAGYEAHHIIPWIIPRGAGGNRHPVVQAAAAIGFHLNHTVNGINLQKYSSLTGQGLHGNHPAYTDFVKFRMDTYMQTHSPLDALDCQRYLEEDLIVELRNKIGQASNSQYNLNEYFKNVVNPAAGIP